MAQSVLGGLLGAMVTVALLSIILPTPAESCVLVVSNSSDRASVRISQHYAKVRHIPSSNLISLALPQSDEIARNDFIAKIQNPIRSKIADLERVDYIVLIRGVPLRLDNRGGNSVDSELVAMNLPGKQSPERNPYFGANEPFDSRKVSLLLVTRLDGYTESDTVNLIDQSVNARPSSAPVLLDGHTSKAPGYGDMNVLLDRGASTIRRRGGTAILDLTDDFQTATERLAGYMSWGSNDRNFSQASYTALRFVPGAIAETYVSTSGRTFRHTQGGQSLIADLIAGGVTGVKGYVAEPTTRALARADLLFDRYLAGFNLADSFYAASPVVRWKDVVIGDPLCAPYAAKR